MPTHVGLLNTTQIIPLTSPAEITSAPLFHLTTTPRLIYSLAPLRPIYLAPQPTPSTDPETAR